MELAASFAVTATILIINGVSLRRQSLDSIMSQPPRPFGSTIPYSSGQAACAQYLQNTGATGQFPPPQTSQFQQQNSLTSQFAAPQYTPVNPYAQSEYTQSEYATPQNYQAPSQSQQQFQPTYQPPIYQQPSYQQPNPQQPANFQNLPQISTTQLPSLPPLRASLQAATGNYNAVCRGNYLTYFSICLNTSWIT